LNDVLRGERVVVGVMTTEKAWKRGTFQFLLLTTSMPVQNFHDTLNPCPILVQKENMLCLHRYSGLRKEMMKESIGSDFVLSLSCNIMWRGEGWIPKTLKYLLPLQNSDLPSVNQANY
jgi:hypothetical protein